MSPYASIHSEIGRLKSVILHSPGPEVENMTPANAERALYSDILNLAVARKEYQQFRELLKMFSEVYEVKDLLQETLKSEEARQQLIHGTCLESFDPRAECDLAGYSATELSTLMIEGVELKKDNLTRFLSPKRFAIKPLHNFFFTRDSAITLNDRVMIARMANQVRERESLIMEAIFNHHPALKTDNFRLGTEMLSPGTLHLEGGDVLVAREDLLLVGIGSRTTTKGVDAIIEQSKANKRTQHILVQELPLEGESFIHLDMVFTFLSQYECMVYEPVIMQPNRLKTILITVDNGKIRLEEKKNLPESLKSLGIDLNPIQCGGNKDPWTQEREQWHSGANFLAMSPGKVVGYSRNEYTMEALNQNGYEIIKASDVIKGKIDPDSYEKAVFAIDGSELSRGGGGARCMSMPLWRSEVEMGS